MKRSIMLILCLAVVFLFTGMQEVECASKMKTKVPVTQATPPKTPPDLTVTVAFAHIETWSSEKCSKYYSPRPIFTIKNNGGSTAYNFKYTIEWKLNPTHTWSMYSGNTIQSLGPGATKTIDFNSPIAEQPWCVDDPTWKPGWRITADTENTVSESNENNNVAEKIFTLNYMPNYQPPKTIQKDLKPVAPIQR